MKDYDRYIFHDQEMSEKHVSGYTKILRDISGSKILDVGCGTGLIASSFIRKNNDVYGLDNSRVAISNARNRGIKAMLHDINTAFPFDENYFDVVICADVLEHLEHPLSVLKEIKRVLKNEGILLVNVPNQFTVIDRFKILLGKGIVVQRWFPRSEEWNFPHLRFFTYRGFKKFLESAKFQIIGNYPEVGAFHTPLIKIKMVALAKFFPSLFSTGITFKCINIKH